LSPMLMPTAAFAQAKEYKVKAALILNIAKFTEWPDAEMPAGKPVVVTIIGADPFEGSLDEVLKGKDKDGRSFEVKKIASADAASADDLKNSHIVFMAASQSDKGPAVLEKTKGSAVLVIGDEAGFPKDKGMVALPVKDGKVAIEVNPDRVSGESMKMSSKLLGSATIVK
jgi:YfiR/HmsC-like